MAGQWVAKFCIWEDLKTGKQGTLSSEYEYSESEYLSWVPHFVLQILNVWLSNKNKKVFLNVIVHYHSHFSGCLFIESYRVKREAYHPENGSTGLFYLLRAAPSRLHRGQAEVTNLNSPALMEKNV